MGACVWANKRTGDGCKLRNHSRNGAERKKERERYKYIFNIFDRPVSWPCLNNMS